MPVDRNVLIRKRDNAPRLSFSSVTRTERQRMAALERALLDVHELLGRLRPRWCPETLRTQITEALKK